MKQLSSKAVRIGHKQSGAVLFVALMFLLLLSVVAVVAANTSLLQERMTGGMRNSQLAMMGADSALRSAEFQIWSAPARLANLTCDAAGGAESFRCYTVENRTLDTRVDRFRTAKGQLDAATDGAYNAPVDLAAAAVPESARLAQRGRVIVELIGRYMGDSGGGMGGRGYHRGIKPPPDAGNAGGIQPFMSFRITARSPGGSTGAVRVAESLFVAQVQPITQPPPTP